MERERGGGLLLADGESEKRSDEGNDGWEECHSLNKESD